MRGVIIGSFFFYWLPPLAWACVILAGSGDQLSGYQTWGLIDRLIQSITGQVPDAAILDALNISIRKAGHVLAYAILALLTLRAVRQGRKAWEPWWVWIALSFTALIATVDEVRQGMATTNRSGSVWDALLDITAAALAIEIVRRRGVRSEDRDVILEL